MSLKLENLNIYFETQGSRLHAVRNVSLVVREGQSVGLVGESGSGKSITGLSMLGLLPTHATTTEEFLSINGKKKCEIKNGRDVGMIFQDPTTSLDPCFTILHHFKEIYKKSEAFRSTQEFAIYWLNKVGIPSPEKRLGLYPHELSGGMAQRVMIALVLSQNPKLIIADEPTTALDVTIQKQILSLIASLQNELGLSLVLISHDLGVIAHLTNYLYVMYMGEIVEEGPTQDVLSGPKHPYTRLLLESLPALAIKNKTSILKSIPGSVPPLSKRPQGCQLAPRCPWKMKECEIQIPEDIVLGNQKIKCFLKGELK